MDNTEVKIDNKKFWFGVGMAVAGIILLFWGMLIDPAGEISGSVLAGAGEVFTLSGALVGADVYVDYKMRKMIDETKGTNQ